MLSTDSEYTLNPFIKVGYRISLHILMSWHRFFFRKVQASEQMATRVAQDCSSLFLSVEKEKHAKYEILGD